MHTDRQIIQAIAEHLGLSIEDIDRETSLTDDLSLGPMELNDLLSALMEQFDITFSPEDTENLKTVGDLVMLVEDTMID